MINLKTKNWEINNIENIIWDKDGTIIDQNAYWGEVATKRVLKACEIFEIDEKYVAEMVVKLGYDATSRKLIDNSPIAVLSRDRVIDFFVDDLKNYNVNTTYQIIDEIFIEVHKEIQSNIETFIFPFEEAILMIKNCAEKGVNQILVTSDARENTLKMLKIMEIDKYFSKILGKEDCDEPKETGKILKQLQIDFSKTIAIGDTINDGLMGERAGLKAEILVATAQTPLKILKNQSNYCVNNLCEILI